MVDRHRAVLINAVYAAAEGRAAMHAAVRDYTLELKMAGALPEHALVAIKSAVRASPTDGPAAVIAEEFVAEAAQWCIASYFTGAPPHDPTELLAR